MVAVAILRCLNSEREPRKAPAADAIEEEDDDEDNHDDDETIHEDIPRRLRREAECTSFPPVNRVIVVGFSVAVAAVDALVLPKIDRRNRLPAVADFSGPTTNANASTTAILPPPLPTLLPV